MSETESKWRRIDSCVCVISLAACYCVTVGGCWWALGHLEHKQAEIVEAQSAGQSSTTKEPR